jgi:hypothetical protein
LTNHESKLSNFFFSRNDGDHVPNKKRQTNTLQQRDSRKKPRITTPKRDKKDQMLQIQLSSNPTRV